MVYRAIGLMSGSSLDGLDIVFAEIEENGGVWTYQIIEADCMPYDDAWRDRLSKAVTLSALEYQLLHADYGHYLGLRVSEFIATNDLHFKVALIASHGHTTFHVPARRMTAQLGDGASIAAHTQLPVVSDLRSVDVAFGGQGAPIVPVGERLLLGQYDYFLNLGGIANISINAEPYIAYDVCPANRVLNLLAGELGKDYDDGGAIAGSGHIDESLLTRLNALDYYHQQGPKSLANEFGTDTVYPILKQSGLSLADCARTFTEHIAMQVRIALITLGRFHTSERTKQLLVTGGGAFNHFLVDRIREQTSDLDIELVIPDERLIKYKEALIMALLGILRWREETNVLSTVTGASRDSVGGAMWMGNH